MMNFRPEVFLFHRMIGYGETVEEVHLTLIDEFHNELPKNGVGPSHPTAGEMVGIVFVERFMNETQAGVVIHHLGETLANFLIVGACGSFHDGAHRPNHVVAHMRTPDAFSGSATEEIGIVVTPNKFAGVLINRVVDGHATEKWHGEQPGCVGVVHEELTAEAVDFESIDFSIFGVVNDGIFQEGVVDFGSQGATVRSEGGLVDFIENDGRLVEHGDGKEIARDEERKDGAVVGGTERRGNEPNGISGMAVTGIALSVVHGGGEAGEMVGGAETFLSLLFAHDGINVFDGFDPKVVEGGQIARGLIVGIGQKEGIANGIEFVFAFKNAGLHLGVVVGVFTLAAMAIEGVGVRVEQEIFGLTTDDAAKHFL